MEMSKLPMVDVVKLRPLPATRLWLQFSDGREGEFDLAPFIARGGEMVLPLKDPKYFARAFVEMGAPTWPNGLDLDPINLYMEMEAAGELKTPAVVK
jgi:hypothetical protein